MNDVPWIAGLGDIADDYDAFLVDAWGVLHDGVMPYGAAVDTLLTLRHARKTVVIVSNAARRTTQVAREMAKLGIGPDLYARLVTSGEATWQALNARADANHQKLGNRCFYLGSARSRNLMDGLNLDLVSQIGAADFFLVTGTIEPGDPVERYDALLVEAFAHELVLVCANSDAVAIRGDKRYFCGGALAERYAALGGTCFHYGKPYATIYETCFESLTGTPKDRILAIGDSFDTDMAGADAAGIDALFIAGGVHAAALTNDPTGQLQALCATAKLVPRAAMDLLRW